MAIRQYSILLAILVYFGVGVVFVEGQTPLTTGFTYQGQLKNTGSPANGTFNMVFRLFDAVSGGTQVGPTLTFDGVGGNPPSVVVANGLFTVGLDFGVSPFIGSARWLQITVSGTTLSPRQPITGTPYALHARGFPVVTTVAELLSVLAELPTQGGHIYIAPGTYPLPASIVINRDNVTLEGAGAATYFRLNDHVNQPCFVLGDPNCSDPAMVTRKNIALRSMRIDGNRVNQDNEIGGGSCLRNNCVTLRRCQDSTVEDLVLENARSGGIVTEKGCVNINMRRVTSSGNFFDGIACYQTSRSSLVECTSRFNLDSGLSVDCDFDDNVVTNCFFVDNTKNGLFISNASRNLVGHCLIRGNSDQGVFIRDGDACPGAASENLFSQNFYYCNSHYGLWQAGATSASNVLDGGIFRANGFGAINENASAPLIQYHPTLLSGICP